VSTEPVQNKSSIVPANSVVWFQLQGGIVECQCRCGSTIGGFQFRKVKQAGGIRRVKTEAAFKISPCLVSLTQATAGQTAQMPRLSGQRLQSEKLQEIGFRCITAPDFEQQTSTLQQQFRIMRLFFEQE
jgi:hypothetical protein